MIDFDPQQRALFECIEETIPDLDEKLFEELDDNGIETVEQFEDAFAGSYDGYGSKSPEAQFTEELVSDCGYLDENSMPGFVTSHIDWQEVWDCEMRHDYTTIESQDQTHFFSRHF